MGLSPVISGVIIMIGIWCFGLWLYGNRSRGSGRHKRPAKQRLGFIKDEFTLTERLLMIGAAIAMTLLVTSLAVDRYFIYGLYMILLIIIPYSWTVNRHRRYRETLFANIILYCQNMVFLLRENGNVYLSLTTVVDDVIPELGNDIKLIIASLETGRHDTELILNEFSERYPYTVVRQLNVIMLHMYYENERIAEAILDTFDNDIEKLDLDVKQNMIKRKSLRIQYLMITAGSLGAYWFLLNQLKGTFAAAITNNEFQRISSLYVSITLIILFIVDSYFNENLTKE